MDLAFFGLFKAMLGINRVVLRVQIFSGLSLLKNTSFFLRVPFKMEPLHCFVVKSVVREQPNRCTRVQAI